uniref:Bicarbonate transporter-like transmembrane domain-containing protein n=1 Tax=Tetradesmus obliquus TaxID=3088 RepID=A0A383W2A2_TETOB|eukprot:jgi/Sobl393_1/1182/SZX71350.1
MPSTLGGRWCPGRGIAADVAGRLPWYRDDWVQGTNWGLKVLAPATYIFFASALPALAFGQQLAMDTEGTLTVVHVLVSTALAGLVQSLLGGQPLLIIGVAEPIVLTYGFLYSFAKHAPGLGPGLFLPFAGWVCIWTAVMCLLLALSGACAGIDKFTRFSGEVFGALIAILFFQVGIKGIVHEFQPAPEAAPEAAAAAAPSEPAGSQLLLINGLWGLLLSAGLLLSSLLLRKARGWRLGRPWLRGFAADYGVPLMVVGWSGLSFAVAPANGVPRRVLTPNTWEVVSSWSVAGRLHEVPGTYIAAALLPALIITVLFYFDHNVSSQMAQQPEFSLAKPPAYHYDFLLLAGLTLVCGLLGIPPVNGVLPQAPMHTRSLAHLRRTQKQPDSEQLQELSSTHTSLPSNGGSGGAATAGGAANSSAAVAVEVLPSLQPAAVAGSPVAAAAAAAHDDTLQRRGSSELRHRSHGHPPEQQLGGKQQQQQRGRSLKPSESAAALNTLPDSAADAVVGVAGSDDGTAAAAANGGGVHDGYYLQLQVREQRVTNLLQSLLLAVCLGITPAIQAIPTAVLWGYFIFMAAESLPGSQLWERLLLLATDPQRRIGVLQQEHAAYLQLVPFRVVVRFTLLQLALLLGVWALVTWAGIAGIAFPLPIMALVPLRQYVLPLLFDKKHLAGLDAAAYEEAPGIADRLAAAQELYALGAIAEAPAPHLPVTAASHAVAGTPAAAAAGSGVDDAEQEVLSQEFRGLQLRHHMTPEELAQHRRQPGA